MIYISIGFSILVWSALGFVADAQPTQQQPPAVYTTR